MMSLFTAREYTERIATIAVGIFGQLEQIHDEPWRASASGFRHRSLPCWASLCPPGRGLRVGECARRRAAKPLPPYAQGPEFKLSRLSPAKGFSRIFSAQGWVKLGTDLAKLSIAAAIVWSALKKGLVRSDLLHPGRALSPRRFHL